MRRHATAPSFGSSTRSARGALALAFVFAAFLGIGAPAALAVPPTLAVDPPSTIETTKAHVSGKVTFDTEENGGSEGFWFFEFCAPAAPGECTETTGTWNWGPEAFGHTLPAGSSAVDVEETLQGLNADTEYVTRLTAFPFSGGQFSSPESNYQTFTTDLAPIAPLPTTNPATAVSITTAQISGAVDPEGGNEEAGGAFVPIHWKLELSPTGDPDSFSPVAEGDLSDGEGAESNSPITVPTPPAELTNLLANHTYTYRVVATYAGQKEESAPETFTTDPAANPPLLTLDPAGAITFTKAQLAGSVDPNGGNVDSAAGPVAIQWELQYTPASDPEAWQSANSGTIEGPEAESPPDPIEVSANLGGLHATTEYLYRLLTTYAGEKTSTADSFETLSSAGPDVLTGATSHVNHHQAYLLGELNPKEEATSFWFEYGTEDCSASPCTAIPADKRKAGDGASTLEVSQAIGGLEPQTTYHYRLLAENGSGTAAGADETFTTAAAPPAQSCANEAIRVELHAELLGNCRAWELASPGASKDIMGDAGRTVAATSETPGLPMAVKFSSLGGFGDVLGSGVGFDYLAQRTGAAGTSGWSAHGITPPQRQLSLIAAANGVDPVYELFSADLSTGLFRAFSALPGTSANAEQVPNLYRRDDVRAAGAGSYQLFSDSASPQAPLTGLAPSLRRPWLAGASADLRHVLFETKLNLTADATGANTKLYKSDEGALRLVTASGGCSVQVDAASPCSMAGIGATAIGGGAAHYTPRVLSADGTRANFTSPFGTEVNDIPSFRPALVSKLYQLDDRGTAATEDDATIELSMSEKAAPEPARGAIYESASSDGNRVFFRSAEQLTETPGSGLYLWQRQGENETQELAVDATGGTFTLTAHSQPAVGEGKLSAGSEAIDMSEVSDPGSFTIGQTIAAAGIPAGTTVTAVTASSLTISQPATESGTRNLTASFEATSAPLPADAGAAQVQAALEALELIGAGNVALSGGPAGSAPLGIEFTGALAGVNVMELSADASGLSGGASTASVTTSTDLRNLTLIGPDATGVLGASEDGTRIYFSRDAGGGASDAIKLWQDDGGPGGSVSQVANLFASDLRFNLFGGGGSSSIWNFTRQPLSRVSPDGAYLLFEASDGSGVPPGYQHGPCDGNANGTNIGLCSEAYLYRAETSTPSEPDVLCASCNLAVPGAPGDTFLNARKFAGASLTTPHLSRALTDDGQRVFFNTDEQLVEEDTNGVIDVYEYDVSSGEADIVSGGTDSAPSYLMDASADGSDVFFVTRARLAGWDDDSAYDLYDARIGGGFPQPAAVTAPCNGTDNCHGVGGTPPSPPQVGSAALRGAGNLPGRSRCRKGRRAVSRGGKTRCVKRQTRKQGNRKAGNERRNGR